MKKISFAYSVLTLEVPNLGLEIWDSREETSTS